MSTDAGSVSKTDMLRIRAGARSILGAVGLASWAIGGAATFATKNSAGAVALITAGAAAGLVAMIGRWPSRITISGNSLEWQAVNQTIGTAIKEAQAGDDSGSALEQLTLLRDQLETLRETGNVPEHPAARYDRKVAAAIASVLPDATVIRETVRNRQIADFSVRWGNDQLLVETKWRANPMQPFRGGTLEQLTTQLGPDDRLLVVVNAQEVSAAANTLARAMPGRALVVRWHDRSDNAELKAALLALLQRSHR
jgi:hypothetical protein